MKSQLAVGGMLVAAAVAWAAEPGTTTANAEPGTFGYDVGFLKRCTEVIVLAQGDAQVAVAPAYQGRVMTSTFGGLAGPSFGWLNYRVIERGLVPEPERKGQLEDHIYVFGGEERFWLGPEGGQFAIFFKPGEPFDFDHWHTPAVIDTEPFELVSQDATAAKFKKAFDLVNYSGTKLKGEVERTIRLLTPAAAEEAFGFKLAEGVKAVAYETDNRLFNRGTTPWMKEKGRLSIWLLGMYKPGPATTIVIPFKAGPEAELGPKVNDAYFGKVPADRLVVKDNVLFFSGDGQYRSKLGISPKRSLGLAGSYDAAGNVLTLVTCSVPKNHAGYVNSMWELQKDPYGGDALNSYNDGSPGPGKPPLGPFYELETSSPAAALAPGQGLTHLQRTLHLSGPKAALDAIARAKLGVGLDEITAALKPAK